MKKSLFYLICAVMGGLIAALGLLIAKNSASPFPSPER